MHKLIVLVSVAAGIAAMLAAVPAQATFKGKNGLLAFQAQVGDHVQLFTARPDGSGLRQLTNWSDSDSGYAAWSPDGTKLAFVRYWRRPKEMERLYTMNADGSGLRQLDRKLRLVVAWLPDGKHLLVIRSLRYTIVDAQGRNPRDAGIPGLGSSPCFLGGGRVALLVDKRFGQEEARAIFVGRLGGGRGTLKRITPWEPIADRIDCSPDGSRLVFSTPTFGPPQSANVFTVGSDGTGLRQLTHNRGGRINNGADSWSPDGTRIAFVSNRDGQYQIYTMALDGRAVRQVTHGAEAHLAVWGIHP
jgi:Tol biopolymer transport system component